MVTGDLVNFYATDNAYTVQFADQSDSQAAQAVACQNGAAGDEIWCALAAEVGVKSTIAAGGIVTAQYFAAAADFFGSPLYLGESGKPGSSAGGTYSQLVGYLLARDRILLVPNTALTGVAGSFTTLSSSGAATLASATVTGTLTQTGVATFAAEDVHSAGLNIATLKTLRMPATDYAVSGAITPKGFATLSKAGVGAMTLAAGTAGDILGIFSKTAWAHTVTAGAGITFDGTNNTATFAAAVNNGMLLLCISATLWVVLTSTGITMSAV